MKIAVLLNSLKGYGVQKTALDLIYSLLEFKDVNITIFVLNKRIEELEQVGNLTIEYTDQKGILKSLKYILGHLKKKDFSIIYTPLFHYGAILSVVRSFNLITNIKLVVSSANDIVSSLNSYRSIMVYFLARIYFKKADFAIALNKKMESDFIRKLKITPAKIKTINNPVYNDKIPILAGEEVDHPFYQNKSNKIIVGMGRLTRQKDFNTLIKAFSLLKDRKCKLVILGEGGKRGEIEELIKVLELSERVSLPGFTDNPYKYLNRSHLFVLSSIWEGFGNVLVEALACGLSIVSTNCHSGPDEILHEGRYGRLVPVKDHKRMAEAIDELLLNPLNEKEQKKRANDFHVKKIAKQYYETFVTLSITEDK